MQTGVPLKRIAQEAAAGYAEPPAAATIGNGLTALNDTLGQLAGHLYRISQRLTGQDMEPHSDKPVDCDLSVRGRIAAAGGSAETAEVLARNILAALGE